jgi:SAM-dependent methyltransferase
MRPDLIDILRCPRCRGRLEPAEAPVEAQLRCTTDECGLRREPFAAIHGQPVLIDFERSIVQKDTLLESGGGSTIPRHDPFRAAIGRVLFGTNQTAAQYARYLATALKTDHGSDQPRPKLLVIGGGEIGSGAADLYAAPHIDLIGTDIYASPHTHLLADGHSLPFADQSLDAVWIQAVLEHVLGPDDVVAEIHRVLKPRGFVFADTPFLWPVHEGAFDFTRYTLSGHRWLFRRFELLSAGYSSGVGQTLALAVRAALGGVFRSRKVGSAAAMLFFWVRFLDSMSSRRGNLDACAGMFFFGRKSEHSLTYTDIIQYYDSQLLGPLHERRSSSLEC